MGHIEVFRLYVVVNLRIPPPDVSRVFFYFGLCLKKSLHESSGRIRPFDTGSFWRLDVDDQLRFLRFGKKTYSYKTEEEQTHKKNDRHHDKHLPRVFKGKMQGGTIGLFDEKVQYSAEQRVFAFPMDLQEAAGKKRRQCQGDKKGSHQRVDNGDGHAPDVFARGVTHHGDGCKGEHGCHCRADDGPPNLSCSSDSGFLVRESFSHESRDVFGDNDGVVHQKAKSDDKTGYRHLLDSVSCQINETQPNQDRDGNSQHDNHRCPQAHRKQNDQTHQEKALEEIAEKMIKPVSYALRLVEHRIKFDGSGQFFLKFFHGCSDFFHNIEDVGSLFLIYGDESGPLSVSPRKIQVVFVIEPNLGNIL